MLSMCKRVVCFDLDDTLYKEVDFVASAFHEIASYVNRPEMVSQMMMWFREGKNVFLELNHSIDDKHPIGEYLAIYRSHLPKLSLAEDVALTLNSLTNNGVVLGIITDGRGVSQRHKITALGLDKWFSNDNIIISEEYGSCKTDLRNFIYFNHLYPNASCSYIGDNPRKDFVVPNRLQWQTFMLRDDGRNIHPQLEASGLFRPQIIVNSLLDILNYC